MKVMISWSGERSKQIALALRDFIPVVIQATDPWVSDKDIGAGSVWLAELMEQLKDAKAGVICLTPENLKSEWIHFEAGAIAKAMGQICACPFLFDLKPSDVQGPLSLLQCSVADKDGTRKIIESINAALGDKRLPEAILNKSFSAQWPKLCERIKEIHVMPLVNPEKPVARKPDEILEEVLSLVRDIFNRGQGVVMPLNFVPGKKPLPNVGTILGPMAIVDNSVYVGMYDRLSVEEKVKIGRRIIGAFGNDVVGPNLPIDPTPAELMVDEVNAKETGQIQAHEGQGLDVQASAKSS